MSGPNKYSGNQGAMKNIMDKIIRTVSTEQVFKKKMITFYHLVSKIFQECVFKKKN